jgi:ubiquitin carboxyl-terminal hydrolase 48
MSTKRKRRASPTTTGLAAGEQLKRSTLPGNESSVWGWVGTEVLDASHITKEHRMITCGLSKRSRHPFCPNKYASFRRKRSPPQESAATGELDDDVIVISDDEQPQCSKKSCKNNPNCLNYLGQEKWEDEGKPLSFIAYKQVRIYGEALQRCYSVR